MSDRVDAKVGPEALREQLVAWRRNFHRHPELRFQEHLTASIIEDQLRRLGYQVQSGIAETGLVALLKGQKPGRVVMVRFDMDALPITEASTTSYISQIPGVMHACGHDGHMAIGLGVATLAAQQLSEMAGTLKLVFQPAEEGAGGAAAMIREGVLEKPRPDVFLAAHLWNELPVGTVDVSPGAVMAAADEWTCCVRGNGGHGALPHQAADPIVTAAQIIVTLQTVVSRNVSPLDTAVVTVSAIHGGDAFNVIPPQVEMKGTIRTYQPATRELVTRRAREVATEVASACSAEADWDVVPVTPAVVNNVEVAEVVAKAARVVIGPKRASSGHRSMVSEDAAVYMQAIPGCYFFLGSANTDLGLDSPHHSPRFDFDEGALPIGVAVIMQTLGHYLFGQ